MNIDNEDEHVKSLGDYLAIVKRRRKVIAVSSLCVFIIGLLFAAFWPATYRSTAVILIESQDIPSDLVQSTITSYAVQRIEEIKQRIMTTSNIMSIVQRFELYSEKKLNRLTRTEIATNFRDNVNVEPISADVMDPRSGNPTKAVIAFKLSYDDKEPQKVYKVTNELITLYLNENLRGRTEQSNSTSDFLAEELKSMNNQLQELEEKLSTFKEENQGSLPELNAYNLSLIDRGQQNLIDYNSRIQELESKKIALSAQLTQLNPSTPTILPDGRAVLSDSDRLKALQSEYRRAFASYNEDHPDLIRLRREIDALLQISNLPDEKKNISKQYQDAQDQLAQAKQKYTHSHPEIDRLTKLVESLQKELLNVSVTSSETIPDNPSYILISTQLKSLDSEIESLRTKSEETQQKIERHEALLLKAPSVERDYQLLLRDYDSTRLKYREISEKQMRADLGKNLEQERKGERFTLIQPPEIPEEPVSLNRWIIFFVSLVFAIGIGGAAGFVAEAIDARVWGEKSIEKITGLTALVVIPYFREPIDHSLHKRKILIAMGITLFSFVSLLVFFHFFIKPLDVTWYLLLNKLGFR